LVLVKVLTGRVVSGVGNFSYWIDKLKDYYRRKTGMLLFPGTLNVQLDEDYSIPSGAMRLEGEEYGGTVSINIVPCRIFEEDAVILRTDTNESGEGLHPKTLVEVACEVKLRGKYQLKDGDIVHIEVRPDEKEAE
jgi:riboflavin kinase, archaea type